VQVETAADAPVIGVAVGSANFLTTANGRQYGTVNGTLAERHKRDRETRRRKAKLRAGLKKKSVEKLPSTRNKKLARHVRHESNRAVNDV
jgi:transposase